MDLSGSASPGVTVELTRNGQPAGTVVADQSGNFVVSNFGLVSGLNQIGLVSVDKVGNRSVSSEPLSVRVDLDPPLVGNPIPQPGSRSQDLLPELSVEVSDALGGSGLDESSVSFVLDGDESISGYSLSGGKISYVPSEALSEGEHSFRVLSLIHI